MQNRSIIYPQSGSVIHTTYTKDSIHWESLLETTRLLRIHAFASYDRHGWRKCRYCRSIYQPFILNIKKAKHGCFAFLFYSWWLMLFSYHRHLDTKINIGVNHYFQFVFANHFDWTIRQLKFRTIDYQIFSCKSLYNFNHTY